MQLKTWKEHQIEWRVTLVRLGMSQKDFAGKYDFAEGQVSQWFSGKQKANTVNEGAVLKALLNEQLEQVARDGVKQMEENDG